MENTKEIPENTKEIRPFLFDRFKISKRMFANIRGCRLDCRGRNGTFETYIDPYMKNDISTNKYSKCKSCLFYGWMLLPYRFLKFQLIWC